MTYYYLQFVLENCGTEEYLRLHWFWKHLCSCCCHEHLAECA